MFNIEAVTTPKIGLYRYEVVPTPSESVSPKHSVSRYRLFRDEEYVGTITMGSPDDTHDLDMLVHSANACVGVPLEKLTPMNTIMAEAAMESWEFQNRVRARMSAVDMILTGVLSGELSHEEAKVLQANLDVTNHMEVTQSPNRWFPIELAPLDAPDLLLAEWCEDQGFSKVDIGNYGLIEYDRDEDPIKGWLSLSGDIDEPTHFQYINTDTNAINSGYAATALLFELTRYAPPPNTITAMTTLGSLGVRAQAILNGLNGNKDDSQDRQS